MVVCTYATRAGADELVAVLRTNGHSATVARSRHVEGRWDVMVQTGDASPHRQDASVDGVASAEARKQRSRKVIPMSPGRLDGALSGPSDG